MFYIFEGGAYFNIWAKGRSVADFTWGTVDSGLNIDRKKSEGSKKID